MIKEIDNSILHQGNSAVSERLAEIFGNFRYGSGTYEEGIPYGNGHINDTFRVTARDGNGWRHRFILQRINTQVFRNVDQLMQNISRVSSHLQQKLDQTPGANCGSEALTLVETLDGATYLRTPENECWRAYVFVENATSHDVVQTPEQGYEAARAYGTFQKQLADLPGTPLHETIPDFHNTPKRLLTLKNAIDNDKCGRRVRCQVEADFALSMANEADIIAGGLSDDKLPTHVTHNDTKLNNVMLDDDTGKGVCVIDLDTVMPGSCLYDFGDLVRSAAGDFAENSQSLDSVRLDLERYKAIVDGYLSSTCGFLTEAELQLLPVSALLMTYEVGIRFLTDYLEGDWYFKTSHPDENLHRARVQLAFVKEIRSRRNDMAKLTADRMHSREIGSALVAAFHTD